MLLKLVLIISPRYVILITNYSQHDAMFLDLFIFTDSLYVSGGSSAHHQERLTVYTASGIVNSAASCYLPVAASSSIG